MLLYPQLSNFTAERLADSLRSRPVPELADSASAEHPEAHFTPTGGNRASPSFLRKLRQDLLDCATEYGYPRPSTTEQRRLAFDRDAAILLFDKMQLQPAEASKHGLWNFFCCVLTSDLVRWRFPPQGAAGGTSLDRFLSGRRNTFQRLWWRACFLRSSEPGEPYALLRRLGEDELVQIMERPNLAGNRALSVVIGSELLSAARRHADVSRRELIRETQKRLMRLSGFVSFSAADEIEIQPIVRNAYESVAESIRASLAAQNR